MKDEPFDPEAHRDAEPRYFDDLEMGERFHIPSRTLGDANFAAFQLASGDNHPIHYDLEYCRRQGHPEMLAHGLQVLIQTAPGAGQFPHVVGEALLAFVEQSSRFLKPVYRGDTVYPRLEISGLEARRTTGLVTLSATVHNQRGELVMEGEHKIIVRRRPDGE